MVGSPLTSGFSPSTASDLGPSGPLSADHYPCGRWSHRSSLPNALSPRLTFLILSECLICTRRVYSALLHSGKGREGRAPAALSLGAHQCGELAAGAPWGQRHPQELWLRTTPSDRARQEWCQVGTVSRNMDNLTVFCNKNYIYKIS